MTREQAKALLVTLGIETPSEDQITNYLNSVNKEVKSEKDRAEKYKAEADKTADLQKQLDEMKAKSAETVKETAAESAAPAEKPVKKTRKTKKDETPVEEKPKRGRKKKEA